MARLAVQTAQPPAMSPTTAKLVAAEVVAKARQLMASTPTSWASRLDEREHARRYGQTLRYLQTCYLQMLRVLPPRLESHKAGQLKDLFARLHHLGDSHVEHISELLAEPENHLMTVPKYYYSELRHRQKCMLPQPPKVLMERSILSFLGVETVAFLRNAERFDLLAHERGTDVPAEAWRILSQDARKAALEIISSAIAIFGEHMTAEDLRICVKEEQSVYDELLDGSTGRVRFGSALTSSETLLSEEDEDEEEDEGDGDFCTVESKPIFIVSDCTGESAERTVLCSLGQFEHCFERSCPADITTFRFTNVSMIKDIVKQAQDRKAFIVYTLVDPIANARMVECCERFDVKRHDLWSPLLEKLEGYFDASRLGIPGRRQFVDERYMQLIECIEYTRTLDDGVQPQRWREADIMILGPSRSGKTPLSFFMAQRGYKVANYPLVPDEEVPKELWHLAQDRVFALDIDPKKLTNIRNTRMKALKMGAKTSYALLSNVREELDWCKQLYRRNPQWTVIDTSDAGIEEICARILMTLAERGSIESRISNADHPSAI